MMMINMTLRSNRSSHTLDDNDNDDQVDDLDTIMITAHEEQKKRRGTSDLFIKKILMGCSWHGL